MKKNKKTKISQSQNYEGLSEFWEVHDLADYWDQTQLAHFEIDIQSHITYYAIDNELAASLHKIARKRGISANTLLNLWIQEKVKSQQAKAK